MNREMLSRVVAATILAFLLASFTGLVEHEKLTRMQTWTSQQYYDEAHQTANSSYIHRFVLILTTGVFYMVALEAIAFLLRRGWQHLMRGRSFDVVS